MPTFCSVVALFGPAVGFYVLEDDVGLSLLQLRANENFPLGVGTGPTGGYSPIDCRTPDSMSGFALCPNDPVVTRFGGVAPTGLSHCKMYGCVDEPIDWIPTDAQKPGMDYRGDSPNTMQTKTMRMFGKCLADEMDKFVGTPKKCPNFEVDCPQLACSNTVDNVINWSPHQYGYPSTYPDMQCGLGGFIRNREGVTLSSITSIWEGELWTFQPVGSTGGMTADIPESPWMDHVDDCISNCKATYPVVVGVSVATVSPLHVPITKKDGVEWAPAGQTFKCRCHRKFDFISGVTECSTGKGVAAEKWRSALIKDAGKAAQTRCPCTDGISLTLKTPSYSNLAGAGPDVDSPSEILYPDAGVVDGRVVNVRVWTEDPSYKGNGIKNGVKGSLGRLSMKTGQENTFQVAIVDAETNEPLQLDGALPITFLDLDEGKNSKGRATVSVCGAEQFVTPSSELTLATEAGCASAASSTRGNAKDNPSSVESALTDGVASRRVVSYIMEATETGIYTFKFTVAKGFGYRNFLFSLAPGAACSDETNMPNGCTAALAAEGL